MFDSGTQKRFEHPSIKLLTAISCVKSENASMPVGGPMGEKTAKAVTRVGNALLKIELEKLAVNA